MWAIGRVVHGSADSRLRSCGLGEGGGVRPATVLHDLGGIARTAEALRRGLTRRDIDRALSQGQVVRPAKGWIALPSVDGELAFAARHHVVLSCLTQAVRLKLWVLERPGLPHVAAPNRGAKVRSGGMVVHWTRPLVPRAPMLLEDPLENVLAHVAECQPYETALAVWESALNAGMTSLLSLRRLPLARRAAELLSHCRPFSDSGLESLVHSRLRWLPIPVRQQVVVGGRRVDLLLGERLIVQIDGAHHVGKQRTDDIAHDARLILLGYRVIRLSYEQVMLRWEDAQEVVLGAIARGEHLAAGLMP